MPANPIRTILCPVDLTPISFHAITIAAEMCCRSGARLVLHHNQTGQPQGHTPESWILQHPEDEHHEREIDSVMEGLHKYARCIPPFVERETKLSQGPIEPALLHLARRLPADLLVMGTHGRSDAKHLSLTERIIIQAPCPVLTFSESFDPDGVFPPRAGRRPEHLSVLLPVDFTPRSRTAVRFAAALAEFMPHQLLLTHVIQPGLRTSQSSPEHMAGVERRLRGLLPDSYPGQTNTWVAIGETVGEILRIAEAEDVLFILMAAHAKGPLQRFLFGTTTFSVLHGGQTPVMFVPEKLTPGDLLPGIGDLPLSG